MGFLLVPAVLKPACIIPPDLKSDCVSLFEANVSFNNSESDLITGATLQRSLTLSCCYDLS